MATLPQLHNQEKNAFHNWKVAEKIINALTTANAQNLQVKVDALTGLVKGNIEALHSCAKYVENYLTQKKKHLEDELAQGVTIVAGAAPVPSPPKLTKEEIKQRKLQIATYDAEIANLEEIKRETETSGATQELLLNLWIREDQDANVNIKDIQQTESRLAELHAVEKSFATQLREAALTKTENLPQLQEHLKQHQERALNAFTKIIQAEQGNQIYTDVQQNQLIEQRKKYYADQTKLLEDTVKASSFHHYFAAAYTDILENKNGLMRHNLNDPNTFAEWQKTGQLPPLKKSLNPLQKLTKKIKEKLGGIDHEPSLSNGGEFDLPGNEGFQEGTLYRLRNVGNLGRGSEDYAFNNFSAFRKTTKEGVTWSGYPTNSTGKKKSYNSEFEIVQGYKELINLALANGDIPPLHIPKIDTLSNDNARNAVYLYACQFIHPDQITGTKVIGKKVRYNHKDENLIDAGKQIHEEWQARIKSTPEVHQKTQEVFKETADKLDLPNPKLEPANFTNPALVPLAEQNKLFLMASSKQRAQLLASPLLETKTKRELCAALNPKEMANALAVTDGQGKKIIDPENFAKREFSDAKDNKRHIDILSALNIQVLADYFPHLSTDLQKSLLSRKYEARHTLLNSAISDAVRNKFIVEIMNTKDYTKQNPRGNVSFTPAFVSLFEKLQKRAEVFAAIATQVKSASALQQLLDTVPKNERLAFFQNAAIKPEWQALMIEHWKKDVELLATPLPNSAAGTAPDPQDVLARQALILAEIKGTFSNKSAQLDYMQKADISNADQEIIFNLLLKIDDMQEALKQDDQKLVQKLVDLSSKNVLTRTQGRELALYEKMFASLSTEQLVAAHRAPLEGAIHEIFHTNIPPLTGRDAQITFDAAHYANFKKLTANFTPNQLHEIIHRLLKNYTNTNNATLATLIFNGLSAKEQKAVLELETEAHVKKVLFSMLSPTQGGNLTIINPDHNQAVGTTINNGANALSTINALTTTAGAAIRDNTNNDTFDFNPLLKECAGNPELQFEILKANVVLPAAIVRAITDANVAAANAAAGNNQAAILAAASGSIAGSGAPPYVKAIATAAAAKPGATVTDVVNAIEDAARTKEAAVQGGALFADLTNQGAISAEQQQAKLIEMRWLATPAAERTDVLKALITGIVNDGVNAPDATQANCEKLGKILAQITNREILKAVFNDQHLLDGNVTNHLGGNPAPQRKAVVLAHIKTYTQGNAGNQQEHIEKANFVAGFMDIPTSAEKDIIFAALDQAHKDIAFPYLPPTTPGANPLTGQDKIIQDLRDNDVNIDQLATYLGNPELLVQSAKNLLDNIADNRNLANGSPARALAVVGRIVGNNQRQADLFTRLPIAQQTAFIDGKHWTRQVELFNSLETTKTQADLRLLFEQVEPLTAAVGVAGAPNHQPVKPGHQLEVFLGLAEKFQELLINRDQWAPNPADKKITDDVLKQIFLEKKPGTTDYVIGKERAKILYQKLSPADKIIVDGVEDIKNRVNPARPAGPQP